MGKDLQAMCHRLETEYDNQELLETYSKLETKFSELGGYDYHYKIDMMLGKFGFDKKILIDQYQLLVVVKNEKWLLPKFFNETDLLLLLSN